MAEGETITVFYERFAVGSIHLSVRGDLSFEYDPRWLETRGNFPLSVTLPLRGAYRPPTRSPFCAKSAATLPVPFR